jgi:protein SCO1/2
MALLALFTAAACKPVRRRAFSPEGLAAPTVTPPIPKPDFVLTRTDGTPYDIRRETEGYVTLLFFGYTNCPDICPVHLANIARALKKADPEVAGAIKVVFVTNDPARDTPDVIRRYLDQFDNRFIGLTGDSLAITAAMRQLNLSPIVREEGTQPGGYTIGHSAIVLAFTRDNLAHVVYPFGIRQEDWASDLALLTRF